MKIWLMLSGINGALAVMAAAYGAHGLIGGPAVVEPEVFQTAVDIQIWHAIALLGVAVLAKQAPGIAITLSGSLFTIGIVLFCGSVYAIGITGDHDYATLAPYGGGCLVFGWLCLVFAGLRSRQKNLVDNL